MAAAGDPYGDGGGGGGGGGGVAAEAQTDVVPTLEEVERRDDTLIHSELQRLRGRTNWVLRMITEELLEDCVRADDAAMGADGGRRRCDLCRFELDYLLQQEDPARGVAALRTLPDVARIVRSAVRAHNKCAMLYVLFVALALQRDSIVPMLTTVDPVTGIPSVRDAIALGAFCGKLHGVLTSHTLPMSQHRVRGGLPVYLTQIDPKRSGGGGGGGGGGGDDDDGDPFAGLFLSTTPCPPGATADDARHGQAVQTPLEFVSEATQLALDIFPRDFEAGWPPALAVPEWSWYRRLLDNIRARAPGMPLHIAILRLGDLAARRLETAGEPPGTTLYMEPVVPL